MTLRSLHPKWFTRNSFHKWKYVATECCQMIHLEQFSQMKICRFRVLQKNYSQASVFSNENMLQLKLLLFVSCLANLVLLIIFLLLLHHISYKREFISSFQEVVEYKSWVLSVNEEMRFSCKLEMKWNESHKSHVFQRICQQNRRRRKKLTWSNFHCTDLVIERVPTDGK